MDRSKIVRLIASLCIAIGLWAYVINVVNPSSTTQIKNLPVKLTGEEVLQENNLAIIGSGEYTVDITVRASRSDLGSMSADNFVASADVSNLTMGQDYIVVDVKAPSGYVVEDIRSRKIQVYVDECVKKEVPVEVVTSSNPSGYEAAVLKVYPKTVEVVGAKQLVDNITVYSVALDASELEYEKISQLEVEGNPIDASGNNIKGVRSSVSNIKIEATSYSTKTLALAVNYAGEPWEGAKIVGMDIPTSITVKGPSAALAKISEVSSEKISIEGIFEDFEAAIHLKLPDEIYPTDEALNAKFKVKIDANGSVSFTYPASAIVSINKAADRIATYSIKNGEAITAVVTGPVDVLRTMTAKDITINADISGYPIGVSAVKLSAASYISGINISLSPSSASVAIRKAN